MQDNQNICPNCGATMQQHSFTYECEYCGTIVLKDGLSEIYYKDDLESSIEDKYSYLDKNYTYASQSKYLSCVKDDNSYEELCFNNRNCFPHIEYPYRINLLIAELGQYFCFKRCNTLEYCIGIFCIWR